jgi:hypothetical protein
MQISYQLYAQDRSFIATNNLFYDPKIIINLVQLICSMYAHRPYMCHWSTRPPLSRIVYNSNSDSAYIGNSG